MNDPRPCAAPDRRSSRTVTLRGFPKPCRVPASLRPALHRCGIRTSDAHWGASPARTVGEYLLASLVVFLALCALLL
ncbi:MAG: hypothetical protein KF791_02555 [Verrucomicrobiae bacterium]|nr:hypothetical protein [Verrucomicrobiae bacterium]